MTDVPAMMRDHVPASITKVANKLRALAEDVDQLANQAHTETTKPDGGDLSSITRDVVSKVLWGVANMGLENPAMWLEEANKAQRVVDAEGSPDQPLQESRNVADAR